MVTEALDIGRGESRPAPREFAWPIVAAGLLAVLSAYQLGARSLSADESASVVFASRSVRSLIESLAATEATQTIYYLLLHVWLKFGSDEAWVRLPSVLFGVATILPIYLIGRRIGGQVAGILAAFVFALSSFVIRYDQEARGSSLAMFLAAILTWLLLWAMDRPTPGRWAAYGLLAAVGFYVHFFVVFVVAAHVLFVVATRSWPRGRALVAAGAPILFAGLPLPAIVALQGHVIDWIPPITPERVADVIERDVGGPVLLLVMVELIGLAFLIHQRQRLIWLVLAWLAVPPLAAILISLAKPILLERYLAVSIPAMAIVASVALAAIRPRGVMVASVVGVALLLLVALPQVYQRSSEDWRSAAQWIAAASQPGDRIVFRGLRGVMPIRYYFRRLGIARPLEQVEIAQAEGNASGPVWLVMSGIDVVQVARSRERLGQRYALVEERYFGAGTRVALFRPSG